jgi:hypothetical protein
MLQCSKIYPVSGILALLSEEEEREFSVFVRDCATVTSDDQLISIKGELGWGLAELRKFLPYVSQGPMPKFDEDER